MSLSPAHLPDLAPSSTNKTTPSTSAMAADMLRTASPSQRNLHASAALRQAASTQRSWQLWWREDVFGPGLADGARHYARVAGTTLGGCALAGASALVSAPTVVPPLLALTEATAGSSGLFDGIVVIGPILSSAIGLGGIFGYVAMAAVLSTVVATLFTSEGPRQTRQAWFLSHLALGFALAPLLCVGTAISAPVSLCTWGCTAGLSFLLSCRLHAEQPSWQTALLGVFFALGTAPMGAVAALGMGPAAVVGNAIKFIASGGVSCVVYSAWLNWSRLVNNSTVELDASIVAPSDEWRLSMSNSPDRSPASELDPRCDPDRDEVVGHATVFGAPQNVENFIWTVESYIKAAPPVPLGIKRLLLSGPGGTGKSIFVQAMAHYLNLALFSPITAKLQGADNTALAVLNLFEQAHAYSRAHGKPVILFFDRAEVLFTNRAKLDSNSAADRQAANVINVFLTCLDGVNRNNDTNLIVVAATRSAEKLDPSIIQRFSCHGKMPRPSRSHLHDMFVLKWEQMQADAALREVPACYPSKALRNRVLSRAVQAELVGRDVDALMEGIVEIVSAQHARHTRQPPALRAAFDAERVMTQALEDTLEEVIERAVGTRRDEATARAQQDTKTGGPNLARTSL